MTEPTQPLRPPAHDTGTGYLTAKSCAIAGFAFAVFSMMGQGTWTFALQSLFWNASYPQSAVLDVMAVWGLGSLLLGVVGIVLARRSLRDAVAADGWEAHLARAAVLVAAAGVAFSALGIVVSLIRNV